MFEWSKLEIQELALEVPQMGASELLTPYYGVIHRTEDWPDAAEEIGWRYRPWLLRVFEGTKVWGMPRFIQDEPTPAGRFLAALGSISTATYPLEREPRGHSDNDLMIGDMGSLYLFLDPGGRVIAQSQCY